MELRQVVAIAARSCSRSIRGSLSCCRYNRLGTLLRIDSRNTEEPLRTFRARLCQGLERLAARRGHGGGDMGKIHRLVASRGRLRIEIPRQEIRAVRLEEEPASGDVPHQAGEVCAPPLIADPTGDSDRKAELEVTLELPCSVGEAMRDTTGERRPVLAKDGDEVLMCLALVQEHGLAAAGGELELAMESLSLRRRR